ncbi:MAG TPA: carbohydrate ABC transporter permease [Clostridiales bacterium]|nr:carbohydrate ABC transporter permease [Clostridiales bacterium]
MKTKSLSDRFGSGLMHLLLAVFAICCLYPFILAFMVSISSEQSLINYGYRLVPVEFSTLAYEMVFRDSSIYTGYAVSIFVTVVGTILSLVICGMAGYAMSIRRLRYRNVIAMYFYIPMVFGAGLLPWYLVCTQILQLQNSIWALIVPMLVSSFNIFLMRNYFKTISYSLIESAEIDGCNVFRIFFQIVVPLSTPIIATVTLFIALAYWNDWTLALWFIDKRSLYPLQYMLYKIESIMQFVRQYGSMGNIQVPAQTFQIATLFVTIGPIILVYPFAQRYFVKGIMIGAIKG